MAFWSWVNYRTVKSTMTTPWLTVELFENVKGRTWSTTDDHENILMAMANKDDPTIDNGICCYSKLYKNAMYLVLEYLN